MRSRTCWARDSSRRNSILFRALRQGELRRCSAVFLMPRRVGETPGPDGADGSPRLEAHVVGATRIEHRGGRRLLSGAAGDSKKASAAGFGTTGA